MRISLRIRGKKKKKKGLMMTIYTSSPQDLVPPSLTPRKMGEKRVACSDHPVRRHK